MIDQYIHVTVPYDFAFIFFRRMTEGDEIFDNGIEFIVKINFLKEEEKRFSPHVIRCVSHIESVV